MGCCGIELRAFAMRISEVFIYFLIISLNIFHIIKEERDLYSSNTALTHKRISYTPAHYIHADLSSNELQ
jgi:hypothetical protein